MYPPNPQPYRGTGSKLVLALDVGTTFSAISYTVLENGRVPEVRGVTRFPHQELVNGSFKIPSIIYYDSNGKVAAIGAECLSENIIEQARSKGWFKCIWFKLHIKSPQASHSLPPLPPNKRPVYVFADYLGFLVKKAENFIRESYPEGVALIRHYTREYVVSHPNGWAGVEQQMLREACVQASLVGNMHSNRLHFVTEGESSLHFCLATIPRLADAAAGDSILVVDAGGGTVDFSGYIQNPGSTGFAEAWIPECRYAGSVFVTRKAEEHFTAKLRDSEFAEEVPAITKVFDQTTKIGFATPTQPQYIRFSNRSRDTDEVHDIKSGQLKLSGSVVAEFFQDSLSTITDTIIRYIVEVARHGRRLSVILLVGGYSQSPYMTSKIKALFNKNTDVLQPNQNANKAVADGSLIFFLEHMVVSRISRFALGTECVRDFVAKDSEHQRHSSLVQISPTGKKEITGMFDTIIDKGVQVKESTEFRRPYWLERTNIAELATIEAEIMAYDGPWPTPSFLADAPDKFRRLCTVVADTTVVRDSSGTGIVLILKNCQIKGFRYLDGHDIFFIACLDSNGDFCLFTLGDFEGDTELSRG